VPRNLGVGGSCGALERDALNIKNRTANKKNDLESRENDFLDLLMFLFPRPGIVILRLIRNSFSAALAG
jgi:hypothetical protein